MKKLRSQEAGSSLIEVVVALFVLAVGMLGVLSMQVKSMQFSQSAYYYAQAVYLANDILEKMRSNPSMAASYLLELDDITPAATVDCSDAGVTCSSAELRSHDLKEWRDNVRDTLVSGKSSVANNGDYYLITVQFDDSRSEVNNDDGPTLSEYVLVTEIH